MARVLVIDDAAFMRKMLGDVLNKAGHEVVGEGANGNEAVERYQELRPRSTTLVETVRSSASTKFPERDAARLRQGFGVAAFAASRTMEGCGLPSRSSRSERSMVADAVLRTRLECKNREFFEILDQNRPPGD